MTNRSPLLPWSRDRLDAAHRLNALMGPRRGVTVWDVLAVAIVIVVFCLAGDI